MFVCDICYTAITMLVTVNTWLDCILLPLFSLFILSTSRLLLIIFIMSSIPGVFKYRFLCALRAVSIQDFMNHNCKVIFLIALYEQLYLIKVNSIKLAIRPLYFTEYNKQYINNNRVHFIIQITFYVLL